MSLFRSIRQNVIADSRNSSITNLDVGNTYKFEGLYTSTLGVAAIQVSLFANKNCLIRVEQSPDHIYWDLSDLFLYSANANFGVTVQAISSYVRVVVTTMSETTTSFRLQTALCPMAEPLPRSLDMNGNLRVAIQADRFGNPVENSTLGEMLITKRVRLLGAQFDGNMVDPNFWNTLAATATITQSQSNMILTSGTASPHQATIWSFRRARFVTGTSNKYRAHTRLPTIKL